MPVHKIHLLLQAELSDGQAAAAAVNDQLQQQQQLYITLQHKAETDSREAAAAAATQFQQTEKLKQQMEAQLHAAQEHGDKLQSACDARGRENEDLTAELSSAQASAEKSQVSFVSYHRGHCILCQWMQVEWTHAVA